MKISKAFMTELFTRCEDYATLRAEGVEVL